MYNSYEPGNVVKCYGRFRDPDTLQPVQPANVTFMLRHHTGNTLIATYHANSDPELTNPSSGTFVVAVDTTGFADGLYRYHFESPAGDPYQGAVTGTFIIDSTPDEG